MSTARPRATVAETEERPVSDSALLQAHRAAGLTE